MDYRVLLLVLSATVLASGQPGRGQKGHGGQGGGKRDASWELDATELRHYGEALAVRQRVRRELSRYDLSEQLPDLAEARAENYGYGELKQDIGDLIDSLASDIDGKTKGDSVKEVEGLKRLVRTLKSYNEAV